MLGVRCICLFGGSSRVHAPHGSKLPQELGQRPGSGDETVRPETQIVGRSSAQSHRAPGVEGSSV